MHQRDLVLASRRLQLCEAFLALALVAAVGLPPAHGAQPGTYALGDLLVTFPTQERSYPLIHESRAWRRGLRTHIVMDANLDTRTLNALGAPYNETFSVSPDIPGHPHTIRHALTPMYTYDALGGANGTYSWMLLGDDDTVWSLPAVLRLINGRGLNAEEPHMLSDFQYHCVREHFECTAPVAVDPRCKPCPAGVAYCPCRLPAGCTRRGWNYGECPYKLRASPYGGAGLIFSIGMLRLLARDPHFYLPLALDTVVPEAASGDVALAEGARLLGYGFTHLLPADEAARVAAGSPRQNITRRFFGPHCLFNDGRHPDEHLRVLQEWATRDPAAFRTMVSVHVRVRIVSTSYHNLMRDVLPAYRGIVELLLSMEGEGAAGSSRGGGGGKTAAGSAGRLRG